MSMVGLRGDFKSGRVLGKVGIAVGGNSVITILKPSNSNGDAFLQYLGYVRSPANKDVVFGNISVTSVGISVGMRHHRVKVIFRRFGLCGGGAILRGIVVTPTCLEYGSVSGTGGGGHVVGFGGLFHKDSGGRRLVPVARAGSRVGGRMGRRTVTLLGEVNLRSGTSICPSALSNKRGRHITVVHSVTVGPSIVLFSRPASTLSPRVMKRILRLVGSLTGRKVAVIIIARRVKFTHRITSEILFVSSNRVGRRTTPTRFFRRPGSPELRRFLSGVLWGGGVLSVRCLFNVILRCWASVFVCGRVMLGRVW